MGDLIERLRAIPVWMVGEVTPGWQEHGTTAYEAADELTALRERISILTEAVERAKRQAENTGIESGSYYEILISALGQQGGEDA